MVSDELDIILADLNEKPSLG